MSGDDECSSGIGGIGGSWEYNSSMFMFSSSKQSEFWCSNLIGLLDEFVDGDMLRWAYSLNKVGLASVGKIFASILSRFKISWKN